MVAIQIHRYCIVSLLNLLYFRYLLVQFSHLLLKIILVKSYFSFYLAD